LRKPAAFQFAETVAEGQLHDSIAELLDWLLIPPAFYTTFPAGYGRLSKVMGARLKRRGMMPGMPDIFVFAPRKVFGIELKCVHRYPSAAQRTAHAKLQAVGIRVYICRSIEDVMQALASERVEYRHWLPYKDGQRERPTEIRSPDNVV
jgi:hypothetical protein